MDQITVRLGDGSAVDLQDMTIGVADQVIAFEIEGLIRGLDDDVLESVVGKSLTPKEITFGVADG